MAAQLEARLTGLAIPVDIIDVDTDPELKAQFGWDVPLLLEGGSEICRHGFDAGAFEAWRRKAELDSWQGN